MNSISIFLIFIIFGLNMYLIFKMRRKYFTIVSILIWIFFIIVTVNQYRLIDIRFPFTGPKSKVSNDSPEVPKSKLPQLKEEKREIYFDTEKEHLKDIEKFKSK